jgi:hypothetical protein
MGHAVTTMQARKGDGRRGSGHGAPAGATVQRRADPLVDPLGDSAILQEQAAEGIAGAGRQLPHLEQLQASFGSHDLGDVQAHVDDRAAAASEALGARAYATGANVAFKSTPDLATAAHEAAHVVQQRGGLSLAGGVGQAGDVHEQQADAVSRAVVAGRSAEPILGDPSGGNAGGRPVQFDEEAKPGTLTPRQTRAAVKYNRRRRLPQRAWKQIAAMVKSPTDRPSPELVQALATWQKGKGLREDGRLTEITLQWLALEPGGESLDKDLKSEHTVYLGIRKASRGRESRTLKNTMGARNVDAITGSDKNHEDQVKVGGKWTDLTTDKGIQEFLATMPKLDAARSKALSDFLKKSGAETRDELAQLIGVLYRVETGQSLMKRVVLSGHSGGTAIEGDDAAKIYFSHLTGLNKVFPIAFAQVEDVMVSACNTGHTKRLEQYRKMFPNLKTIWAYAGYSPSGTSSTGSPHHMKKWDRGTRGRGKGTMNTRRKQVSRRKKLNDKNVAIWNKDDGYQTDSPEAGADLSVLITTLGDNEPAYTAGYSKGIIDRSRLSRLQTTLQVLANNYSNTDLTPHGRNLAGIQKMNRHVMYLRHWKETTEFFLKKFGTDVRAGYGDISAAMPNFRSMNRTTALAEIKSFAARVAKAKPTGASAPRALKRLSEVLRDLDPAQIPLFD